MACLNYRDTGRLAFIFRDDVRTHEIGTRTAVTVVIDDVGHLLAGLLANVNMRPVHLSVAARAFDLTTGRSDDSFFRAYSKTGDLYAGVCLPNFCSKFL